MDCYLLLAIVVKGVPFLLHIEEQMGVRFSTSSQVAIQALTNYSIMHA